MAQDTEKKKIFEAAFLRRERTLLSRRAAKIEQRKIGYGTLFLWLFFIGVLIYSLFFSPWLLITKTEIIGESVVPHSLLEDFLQENLSGKKFFIFSRQQLLVVSETELKERWLERFPKFILVTLERHFPHTLQLKVKEQPFLLRWCSGGPCYLLSDDGYTRNEAFVDASYYAPYVYTVVDKSATPIHRGEHLDVISYIRTINILAEQLTLLTALQMDQTLETPTRHAREVRVRMTEGWDVLFNTDTFTVETLHLLARLLEEKISKERRRELLSIDLRMDGKVFIAYRDTSIETMATTEEPVFQDQQRIKPNKEKKRP